VHPQADVKNRRMRLVRSFRGVKEKTEHFRQILRRVEARFGSAVALRLLLFEQAAESVDWIVGVWLLLLGGTIRKATSTAEL